MKPVIKKLGTIDCDLVEVTPIVFRGRLWRFEYVRKRYYANSTGDSYFRFVEHDMGKLSKGFAKGYHLGNVYVEDDKLYVTATNEWKGNRVDMFVSDDMENWQMWNALNLKGYGIYNTSVCKAEDKYVMMFEIDEPAEEAGVPFTARFAVSKDLRKWELTPPECVYDKSKYSAPHCLRYLDGYFYNFFVVGSYETQWQQYVARSRDLINWQESPFNPVLKFDNEQDKKIANPKLSVELRERIANAKNINNSDIDFCEYKGEVIINYMWGNQKGIEFLAEAVYEGTQEQFLKGWFEE